MALEDEPARSQSAELESSLVSCRDQLPATTRASGQIFIPAEAIHIDGPGREARAC
jgi:hypothetical protein